LLEIYASSDQVLNRIEHSIQGLAAWASLLPFLFQTLVVTHLLIGVK
jgi:hypothetical protein